MEDVNTVCSLLIESVKSVLVIYVIGKSEFRVVGKWEHLIVSGRCQSQGPGGGRRKTYVITSMRAPYLAPGTVEDVRNCINITLIQLF
jgi:hypothetical protein